MVESRLSNENENWTPIDTDRLALYNHFLASHLETIFTREIGMDKKMHSKIDEMDTMDVKEENSTKSTDFTELTELTETKKSTSSAK